MTTTLHTLYNNNKALFRNALYLGLGYFLLDHLLDAVLFNGNFYEYARRDGGTINEVFMSVRWLIFPVAILSLEGITHKKAGKAFALAGIYVAISLVYRIPYYIFGYELYSLPFYKLFALIRLLFNPLLFWMLVRYNGREGYSSWQVFLWAFLITASMDSMSSLSNFSLSTPLLYDLIVHPLYIIEPVFIWFGIKMFDGFMREKADGNNVLDIRRKLKNQEYFTLCFPIIIMQTLTFLAIIYLLIYKQELVQHGFLALGRLVIVYSILTYLVYAFSIRRFYDADSSIAYIYLLPLPGLSLWLGYRLYNKLSRRNPEQLHQYRLSFCHTCSNKSLNTEKSLVCGITNRRPVFMDHCEDYDAEDATERYEKIVVSSFEAIGTKVLSVLFGIFSLVQLVMIFDRGSVNSTIGYGISAIFTCYFVIAYLQHKRWVIPLSIILLTFNSMALATSGNTTFVMNIAYMVLVFLIVHLSFPSWRYFMIREEQRITKV